MASPPGPLVLVTTNSLTYIHAPSHDLDSSQVRPRALSLQLEVQVSAEELPFTPLRARPSWPPRPPKSLDRKRSPSVSALQLDPALDKKRFGLANIQVYNVSPTDPFEFDAATPIAMEYRPPAPISGSSPANGSTPRAAPQSIPSTSRVRHPPPPSPLSKVSSPSDPPQPSGPPLSPPAVLSEAHTSPCYIHSYLDKHGNGSLHDYLHNKSSQSSGTHASPQRRTASTPTSAGAPHTARPHHVHSPKPHVQIPSHVPHASSSTSGKSPRGTSPVASTNSMSGYESDRSEVNGVEGDYDEEGGNLTKQLAETAQGVREMSKELERTQVRSRIQSVLIVTKARDNRLIRLTRELAIYLMTKRTPSPPPSGSERPKSSLSTSSLASQSNTNSDRGMIVYVDAQLRQSKRFDAEGIKRDHPEFSKALHRRRSSSSVSGSTISAYPSSSSIAESNRRKERGDDGQLRYWTSEMCSSSPHLFDFVITLGGDGTVLFTSWLFQKIVPPILPFALGSLGFLTNFDFSDYAKTMDRVLDEGIRVNLRMRFTCTVYRAVAPEEATKAAQSLGGNRRKAIKRPGGEILMSTVDKAGWEALEGPSNGPICRQTEGAKDKEIMCFSTRPVEQFEVLNDLVVDRGPSPYVSLLEIFGDEHHLTTVQADGLTVSTPTGSTAYSLSAGGSLVHPQIPAILLTPICPHTLSFRPMLLPDSMELRICVPYNSRSTAWASFDGRGRVELKQGDHIKVTASKYPFPTVCADKASTDWFSSISRTLRWNEREKQKSFVVVEEDGAGPSGGVKGSAKRQERNKKHAEAGNADDPRAAQKSLKRHEEEDEEEDEEDEEDEDDTFDIDDASTGEGTVSPSSPAETAYGETNGPSSSHPNKANQHQISPPASGVSTPSRFATQCAGPPAISQRHLVQKLAAAELKEKDNERGQRDEIRSDSSVFRIPDGGSALPTATGDGELDGRHRSREREGHHHHHEQRQKREASQGREGKAKAFAFFGQDDSGSEMSDDLQEP